MPSIVRSFLPVFSAFIPSKRTASRITSVCLGISYSSSLAMNVKLRFPRSWYTAPPPEILLASLQSPSLMDSTLHSRQGFWFLPITTVLAFCHRYIVTSPSAARKVIYSSVARLINGLVQSVSVYLNFMYL